MPAEGTVARLRYALGGDRPSQTARQAGSRARKRASVRLPEGTGWYLKVGSAEADAPASRPPTYPARSRPEATAKLQ